MQHELYSPNLGNHSKSLFGAIDPGRTCEQAHIHPKMCVCPPKVCSAVKLNSTRAGVPLFVLRKGSAVRLCAMHDADSVDVSSSLLLSMIPGVA